MWLRRERAVVLHLGSGWIGPPAKCGYCESVFVRAYIGGRRKKYRGTFCACRRL